MQPATYWRRNKAWSAWLGRTGKVIASTTIRVAADGQSTYVPYDFAVVDFGNEKHSFMGAGHESFQPGDMVRCILRRLAQPNESGIMEYGIKITKEMWHK